MMKVIFLDIDGVLNSVSWNLRRESKTTYRYDLIEGIDPSAVAFLNKIIEKTSAVIVLSSTWRSLAPINRINRALKDRGMCKPLLGITPPDGYPRGNQIQEWLDMAGDAVESFVILDDDSDMVHLSPYLVQTSWEHGLREEHVEPAVKLLGAL